MYNKNLHLFQYLGAISHLYRTDSTIDGNLEELSIEKKLWTFVAFLYNIIILLSIKTSWKCCWSYWNIHWLLNYSLEVGKCWFLSANNLTTDRKKIMYKHALNDIYSLQVKLSGMSQTEDCAYGRPTWGSLWGVRSSPHPRGVGASL